MNCKICGDRLLLQNNVYMCDSCHNSFSISMVYENNDVFIAYTETDLQGRRTKESIISQEIYNRLQSKSINTFYQRISADYASGEALETICDFAASNAKVIVVVGASKDSFEKVVRRYKSFFATKTILPVCVDIEADNLPQELKNLQALNYSNVGNTADLVRIILHILNRDDEIDVSKIPDENKRKRNVYTIASLLTVIGLLIVGFLYFVFGTTNILPSKKYEAAQQLLDKNKYVEAIEGFSAIMDYKNSSERLNSIYNQYIGYYYDENSNIGLHLSIENNIKAITEIRMLTEKVNLVINEMAEIDKNKISFNFNDSENNQGKVDIILQNDGIQLNIITEEIESDCYFNNTNIFFDLANKSDKPFQQEITVDIIKKWISKRHSEGDIRKDGFDLKVNASHERISWYNYCISNTDIIVDFFDYEIYDILDFGRERENTLDEEVAFFFTVPAKIIIPDKIGTKGKLFFAGDNLFVPNIDYFTWSPPNLFGFCGNPDNLYNIIEEDTPVLCTSKNLLGEEFYMRILDENTGWPFFYY